VSFQDGKVLPLPACTHPQRRERDVIAHLASMIGPTGTEDGGPGIDTLGGWLYRVKAKIEKLEKENGEADARVRQMSKSK
jgi:hypothetical protein